MASTTVARMKSRGVVGALENFTAGVKEAPPNVPKMALIEEGDSDDEEKKRGAPAPKNPFVKLVTFDNAPDWCHDVTSDSFNMFVGLIISMNALIIGMETDLGEEHFQFFEHFFCIFFIGEMAMRQYQLGCHGYFCDGSNVFDFSLVASGTIDLYLMKYLVQGKKGGAVSTLRLLRMLRVMRILRLFKVFHELSIILAAFLKAFSAVMWVSILTLIFDYVCAVFLTQTVGHKSEWWGKDHEKIETWFGSIGNSMRTLFIIMTLAEWDEIALELQKQIPGLVVFAGMILYIMVAAFTMVSLITGIISEALIRAQAEDADHRLNEIEDGKEQFKKDLLEIFGRVEGSEDGFLSPKQIDDHLGEGKDIGKHIFAKLASLEVDIDKAGLMDLVQKIAGLTAKNQETTDKASDGAMLSIRSYNQDHSIEDSVKIVDLVDAMESLKGVAKASAVWDLKHSLQSLEIHQNDMHKTIREMGDQLKALKK